MLMMHKPVFAVNRSVSLQPKRHHAAHHTFHHLTLQVPNSSYIVWYFGRMRHSKPHMLKSKLGLSLEYSEPKVSSHWMVLTERRSIFLISQKTDLPNFTSCFIRRVPRPALFVVLAYNRVVPEIFHLIFPSISKIPEL